MNLEEKNVSKALYMLALGTATISLVATGCTSKDTNTPDDLLSNEKVVEENETNDTNEVNDSKQNADEKTQENKNEEKSENGEKTMEFNQFAMPQKGDEYAIINTNMGTIKIRLFPEKAPKTVENFVTHAKEGYYNNIIFHRVIQDFMIQTGDPEGTGYGGESIWGKPFEDEVDENLLPYRGAVAMANTGQPCTNGSQFFIVQPAEVNKDMLSEMEYAGIPKEYIDGYKKHGGTPHLDFRFTRYRHTVFGQIIEGLDVLDAISKVETNDKDKPIKDVVISSIDIAKYQE